MAKKKAVKVAKKATKVAKMEKDIAARKPTKRDKAIEAARNQLHDGLHAVVMSAPSLVDAKNIIEQEVKNIRRTMLEEWYRDNPEDLVKDSELEIDIKDKDDVANQAAEFVAGMDDEGIDQWLMEYI